MKQKINIVEKGREILELPWHIKMKSSLFGKRR